MAGDSKDTLGGIAGAAAAATAQIASQNLQLPPLRTLDDFVLGSARFQLPNLRDLEKWGNRVIKNLLYYQTNYFLMFLIIYTVMAIMNPLKIVSGILAQALLIAIFVHFFRENASGKTNFIASRIARGQSAAAINDQQKWYFLSGTVLFSFLLLYWIEAIVLTIFTLLLPVSLTFVHASLRLRNIRNKVANTMESFGPATPMGAFLDAINVTAETILS